MNTKPSNWVRRLAGVTALLMVFVSNAGLASARILFQDDDVGVWESDQLQVGSNDAGVANTSIKFGADTTASENGVINWNISTNTFELDHTTAITGGLSATGQVNFSGATGMRIREVAVITNPGTPCASVGELIMETSTSTLYTCANAGTDTWAQVNASGGDATTLDGLDSTQFLRSDVSDNYTSGTLTFDNGTTLTVNGVATIGDGGDAVAINSSDWGISTTGAMTGVSGITNDATFTTSGGAVSVNNNSNFATDINTGTSTGAVSVGGGLGTVAVNSTTWDISTTGAGSGFTGFTSTGTVDFSGTTRLALSQGAANPGTCTEGDIFYNTAGNTTYVCTATNTWSALSSGGIPDFEVVYGADADKTLTTTNGAFTIAAGTGALSFNSTNAAGVSINDSNAGPVNIGTGTGTGTVTLGGTGTQTINLGNGAGAKTVNLGSSNTTSTTTILSGSGAVNVNANNNQPTNINTGTSTGAVSVGGGSGTVAIDSSVWDITSAGVASGLTGLTSSGTVSFTSGMTASGGAVDLNANSNNPVNIGTGTSTGLVSIGGGAGTAAIDTTTWDITSAGAASGFTTINASGNFTTSGGDLVIGSIGLNDVGVSNVTSGASLVGAFDEFANSNSTTVQGVLNDLDALIGASAANVDQLTFFPEYPDVVVWMDGTSNVGTMTSDFDSTNRKNYYRWQSTKNSLNDIDLRFRYKLPADWVATGDLTLEIRTATTTATDNKVDLTLRNETDNTQCATSTANVSGTANTWATVTIAAATINTGCSGASTLAAGDIIEIIVKPYADNTNLGITDVGKVQLDYTN